MHARVCPGFVHFISQKLLGLAFVAATQTLPWHGSLTVQKSLPSPQSMCSLDLVAGNKPHPLIFDFPPPPESSLPDLITVQILFLDLYL